MSKDKKAKKRKKPICSQCGTKKSLLFAPCPFAFDLYADDKKVWLCDKCRSDRADDI